MSEMTRLEKITKSEEESLEDEFNRAKPCPFCGSTKLYITGVSASAVCCQECECTGPYKTTELFHEHQNAFEAWNNWGSK